ncbi:MAG: type II secretion system F family protein [Gammaproteobacteria bacterium]|nr:type II secretion system F family protein [Gammaproteobacteria bacterium]MBU1407880.1 type II secretion system F family protein [Gammaproteobacteria bacterium]MBU1531993.1 type II secretion system F family protein [Gammaproteobacteria bacterium]
MPRFSYTGRTQGGEKSQGFLEADNAAACASSLQRNGIIPIAIQETGQSERRGAKQKGPGLFEPSVQAIDVQLFSRQLYTLMRAGVPILRSLTGLIESTTNAAFARVIASLKESLEAGRDLSTAMRQHPAVFSPFYVAMVRVGEATGRLDEIFLRMFEHLEFERETRARIKEALRYPTFVLIAMVVAVAVINVFVIPAFAKVYAGLGAELPLMTRILIGTSRITIDYGWLMLAGVVMAVAGFRMWSATPGGRLVWDRVKLRIPITGTIVLKSTLARFARTLALSLKSGIPAAQALSVVAEVTDNAWVASRVEQMRNGIERGESILRTAQNAAVFNSVVLQMIAVGEETGSIDELMQEVAGMYEREVDYEIKTLAARVEPLIIVAMGGIVLVLALGVFLPMWDLASVAIK